MAYDATTGTIVLFGGYGRKNQTSGFLGDTWTWDGSAWTKQEPATHPHARDFAPMAYDAATGTIVLFGGAINNLITGILGDTWTWDGSAWTKQAPATHPHARDDASMAYDAATGTIVMFGGYGNNSHDLGDTWTWK